MVKEVTFVIGQMGLGGAERVVSVLANGFAQKNIKVNLITIIKDEIQYELNSHINYYNISSKYSFKLLKIIDKVLQLRRLLKSIPGKTVISFLHGPILYTIVATLYTNKKIFVSERNNPYREPANKIGRFIRNLSYYFADKVIFQTNDAMRYFSKDIQKKGVIIENPIESNIPLPYIGDRKPKIILACRLEPQKNIRMFIDAFYYLCKDYPQYTATIYGEGPLRHELESYIKQLKLEGKILLPGFSKNLHKEMRDAKIYVSSSDYEGISNSMIEALALGVPTVVTDCPIGGAKMFINNNVNGVLVPVGDSRALYKGMKKIIECKEFSDYISENSIKIREQLNSNTIIQRWLEILD